MRADSSDERKKAQPSGSREPCAYRTLPACTAVESTARTGCLRRKGVLEDGVRFALPFTGSVKPG